MADEGDVFESVKSDLSRVAQFLNSKQPIINAHNVDFFTTNLWETCLSQGIRDDLDKLTETEIASLPSLCIQWIDKPEEHLIGILEQCPNVLNLFTAIREHHLKCLPYVLRSEFIEGLEDDRVLTAFMMSPKKGYEVGVMSRAVYDLVQKTQAKKVVDVGSGKGYLSQYLALRHGINVMGIDSSDSNTKNAEKRNERTLKVWHFLLKKANGKIQDSGQENIKDDYNNKRLFINESGHCSQTSESKCVCDNSTCLRESGAMACECSVNKNIDSTIENHCTDQCQEISQNRTGYVESEKSLCDRRTCLRESGSGAMACECCVKKNIDSTIENHCTDQCQEISQNRMGYAESECKNTNELILEGSNHDGKGSWTTVKEASNLSSNDSMHNNVKSSSTCEHKNPSSKSPQRSSYQPVTAFVSADAKIVQDLGTLFDEESKEGLVLVGLHTCGDLAPTAIKIFLNDSCVKALCLVGCCYHLLSQPSTGDKEISQANEAAKETEYGFPVSEYLSQQNFRLSRNATMVAQQAADRLASVGKIPSRSIFYRAVLQVLLKEKCGLNTTGMHVGRIGTKCKTFAEYVSKSCKKLGLPSDMITPEDLEYFYKRFESQERQIMAFHQLRACIAPCIESLFLMDRLCYLHEQGVKDARIVALFDPVKSPRSYAIVASK